MTEFVGLDLEMAIDEHYHEVLDTIDAMFLAIFRGLKQQYVDYPSSTKWTDHTQIFT